MEGHIAPERGLQSAGAWPRRECWEFPGVGAQPPFCGMESRGPKAGRRECAFLGARTSVRRSVARDGSAGSSWALERSHRPAGWNPAVRKQGTRGCGVPGARTSVRRTVARDGSGWSFWTLDRSHGPAGWNPAVRKQGARGWSAPGARTSVRRTVAAKEVLGVPGRWSATLSCAINPALRKRLRSPGVAFGSVRWRAILVEG